MNKTGKGGLAERKQHINRKGRPKNFDALRSLAQQIAHDALPNGMTVAEAMLKQWAGSKDARLQIQFMEIAFGKVPTIQEHSGPGGKPIQHEDVSLTDTERAEKNY